MSAKHVFYLIIKIIIVVASYLYVVYTLIHAPDLKTLPALFGAFSIPQFLVLIFVFILMWVNWSIEIIKWRLLIKPIEKISFLRAFYAVFSGVTVGMLTPNRVGEFGGRILFVSAPNRARAGVMTIAGSLSQLVITLAVGIVGFVSLLIWNPQSHNLFKIPDVLLIVISLALALLVLYLFLNSDKFAQKISKWSVLKKLQAINNEPLSFSKQKKWQVLGLSLARYVVFVHQFFLLVWLLQIQISYFEAISAISVVYLLMAIIPVISMLEPGVRVSVSIIIFSIFTHQSATVFTASLLLWLINVAVPVIIGSLFIVKLKTGKNEN
jgi:uncharacterized membrane protein YbhN (UPF0104 family)